MSTLRGESVRIVLPSASLRTLAPLFSASWRKRYPDGMYSINNIICRAAAEVFVLCLCCCCVMHPMQFVRWLQNGSATERCDNRWLSKKILWKVRICLC